MSPLLIAIGNLDFWFEVLDEYSGPEAARCGWLASQWTSFGDDITDAEWVELRHSAELLITEWRARKTITEIAASLNDFRPVPASLNDVTALVCGDVLRSMRKAS